MLGAKPDLAVPRGVLVVSRNAAECAWTIVLPCGLRGAASTHHWLARAGGEGCPGPHLLMQPRQALGTGREGRGGQRCSAPHGAMAGPAPAQVGFRKGPGTLLSRLASRSQLELVLCAVAVSLALLLSVAVITLAIQYRRGRETWQWSPHTREDTGG